MDVNREIRRILENYKTKAWLGCPDIPPKTAIKVLKMVEERLARDGFHILRTPFGWLNTLELRAKSHPLSRVARKVSVNSDDVL